MGCASTVQNLTIICPVASVLNHKFNVQLVFLKGRWFLASRCIHQPSWSCRMNLPAPKTPISKIVQSYIFLFLVCSGIMQWSLLILWGCDLIYGLATASVKVHSRFRFQKSKVRAQDSFRVWIEFHCFWNWWLVAFGRPLICWAWM